jgi:hypothetical protein
MPAERPTSARRDHIGDYTTNDARVSNIRKNGAAVITTLK